MKITAKTDCAIRALIQLALEDERLSVKAIAEKQNLSVRYLEQVISQLKKNKLVNGIKGPSGGYSLSMQTEEVTLYQIIKSVEADLQFAKETSHDAIADMMYEIWNSVDHHIEERLGQVTLKDMVEKVASNNDYMYYI